ncbi:MAG: hypothetical protein HY778_14930 [Betaproteobacteria bacterium]|nr:hypothetical protein [Betaproteobacteria bacterium]
MSDLVSVFANLILYTTLGTIAVAIAAYMAYKLRERRAPRRHVRRPGSGHGPEPVFLVPFELPPEPNGRSGRDADKNGRSSRRRRRKSTGNGHEPVDSERSESRPRGA